MNIGIDMIPVPAGSFLMGSPSDELGRFNDEGPQHEVHVERFWMSRTPITQAQWRAVAEMPQVDRPLNPDPSHFKGENRPVECVSWDEAMEFCARLSQKDGITYTLPTEEQWEYACRAGTTTPFHFGETISSKLANFDGSFTYGASPRGIYRQETTNVGIFPPNAWGLHDMHGNVWEWCLDNWSDNYEKKNFAAALGSTLRRTADRPSETRRPGATASTTLGSGFAAEHKVLRGGSWFDDLWFCRSADRLRRHQDLRLSDVGFRICHFA